MRALRCASRERCTPAALVIVAGSVLGLAAPAVFGAPEGARVARGSVSLETNGANTVIRASDGSIINYRSFDIAPTETVRFIQPGASARVLNRIDGGAPTNIEGSLIANGRVFIVNPAGVIFGPNSVVNAAGLYAAAGNISDRDFVNSRYYFANISGEITARGLMTAEAVHLIGRSVSNHGQIVASGGVVSMLVGDSVLVQERGSTIAARITDHAAPARAGDRSGAAVASIENTGSVEAPGGSIVLGAGDAVSLAVHNTGSFYARNGTIDIHGGSVGLTQNGGSGSAQGDLNVVSSGDVYIDQNFDDPNAAFSVTAENGSIVFGEDPDAPATPAFLTDLTLRASSIDLVAANSIVDDTLLGADLIATSGGISLTALDGSIAFGSALVETPGQTVSIVQTDSMFIRPTDLLVDPASTRLVVRVTGTGAGQGDLTFGGNFGGAGSGPTQELYSLDAFAARNLTVHDGLASLSGDTRLEAAADIVFGRDPSVPTLDPPIGTLGVSGRNVTVLAANDTRDYVLLGTRLGATSGDVSITARRGYAEFGLAAVPSGRTVFLTQSDSRFVGAGPGGFIASPTTTNLVVDITGGSLIFGGDFGGSTGAQEILSVDADAATFLRVDDDLTLGDFARLRSAGDVLVDGSVLAVNEVTLHAATDGSGGLRFLSGGLEVGAPDVRLVAGTIGLGGGAGEIDALTNAPSFTGAGGGATSPDAFSFRQDVAVGDGALPSGGQFGAGVAGVGYLIESFESDVVLGDGAKVAGSALTLASSSSSAPTAPGRTFIGADLGLESLVVLGNSTLSAGVAAATTQRYDGAVELGADVSLSAGASVTFDGVVDAAAPGGQGLSVATLGNTTIFNAPVGEGSPLAYLTIDGPTFIGNAGAGDALVRTVGSQTYNGDVTIQKDASLVSTADGTIRFGGALDGAYDLDLVTDDGLIVFAGPVGATERLGRLSLSSAGASGVRSIPDRATVVGEGDLLVLADAFEMGLHEKLTVLGSLEVDALTEAALGDIVAIGDLTVSAPVIRMLLRDGASVLASDGSSSLDAGLDFAAAGEITFDGLVVLDGAGVGQPLLGTPSGGRVDADNRSFVVIRIPSSDVETDAVVLASDGETILDQLVLVPVGPIASANDLVDQRPVDPEFSDSVTPRVYELDRLQRLAIGARGVAPGEARGTTTLFADIPASLDESLSGVGVAAARFDPRSVRALAGVHERIFGAEGEDRSAEVAETLSRSISDYMSLTRASSLDPTGFRRYLLDNEGQADAAALVAELETLMDGLRALGLNDREFRAVRNRIVSSLLRGDASGVDPDVVGDALERADTGLDGDDGRIARGR